MDKVSFNLEMSPQRRYVCPQTNHHKIATLSPLSGVAAVFIIIHSDLERFSPRVIQ